MSDRVPARGVVVGHAEVARGLVGAVRRIAGDAADSLHPLSNDCKSPDQLREELDEVAGSGPVVVFVDLQNGSCGMAALQCCRDRDWRVVVCGVNLPMLLDFVFNRELPLDELVVRLIEKGRTAISQSLPMG